MNTAPVLLPIDQLHSHPRNPRFAPREDIVAQIAAQLQAAGAFDPAHALIVRTNAAGYEILSGHHRALAAQQAGVLEVPCWVREMSDADAYMALRLMNTQGELHPLEEGRHALDSQLGSSEYGRQTGTSIQSISQRMSAAAVAERVLKYFKTPTDLRNIWSALAIIHPAPEWLWPALVAQLLADGWTVEQARQHVKPLQKLDAPPDWSDQATIATAVVTGALRAQEVARFAALADETFVTLRRAKEDNERFVQLLLYTLRKDRPGKLSDVQRLCQAIEQEQQALVKERQQADLLRTKRQEEIAARIARLRTNVELDEWGTLAADEQDALLHLSSEDSKLRTFNKQDNAAIEWAQWSWNPVTGCLHGCPYCYARDITENGKFAKVFPFGFKPMLRPEALLTPHHMAVPVEAIADTRYKNVFTCSMADLFGRWVPAAWIEAVFAAMRAAPQWNFLCLTKFPKRLMGFALPENGWFGTTVDLQARVKAAEDAFAGITAGVRWLSVEPLLEPLHFQHLERFDWMVIGGASSSSQTPEWRPPYAWIADLVRQADDAGCKVYFKANLLGKRRLELPFDASLPAEEGAAPQVFHYLKEQISQVVQ